ncbi:hypothetical protein CBA19CS91_26195 [Paraburkholderia hospita]|nr:hypothetical protein CBA19CS91_26195 [Paraburkholderia hospita]
MYIENLNIGASPPPFRGRKAWDTQDFDLERKRLNFVGRDWLFDEIEAWLEPGTAHPDRIWCGQVGVHRRTHQAQSMRRDSGLSVLQAATHDTLNAAEVCLERRDSVQPGISGICQARGIGARVAGGTQQVTPQTPF